MSPSVSALWQRYRLADPSAPAEPQAVYHFCDNEKDADGCADLVVAGRKRATATSLPELERDNVPVPRAGDHAVITGWNGEARAVIRTTSVDICKFSDVDADFARTEGEGDLTLEWWRAAHRAYYERVLAGSGYTVDDDLQIACERFEVVLLA
jgi:uncharacterized protein YhfF